MKLRSLLFVPADRPERFEKAAASHADALVLDLEDSVAPEKKAAGRASIAAWLAGTRS
jgi:citrate lyase subunit beta/citryl-CoA lyase